MLKNNHDSKNTCTCPCSCVRIMKDIIYVYDKLPEYHTVSRLSDLNQLKKSTGLSVKNTLQLFFSKTGACLLFRDLHYCRCCLDHIQNKPRCKIIVEQFDYRLRF